MVQPKSPTRKTIVVEAEKRLAEAFRKVEAEGSSQALKAHADRLSREGRIRKTD